MLTEQLVITGLVRRFGPVAALDGVELTVARGELFVLLGGSGSGKTTLLRCLGGFERPDAGSVTLDGRDLLAQPAWRRPVNTMFQSYALFPHMTVARNVAFGLRGLPRAEAATRVEEMLALVRLEGFAARRPHELSGGQQQRVALARALARRPQLLLLDEPLSALDRGLRDATRRDLVALQRRLGTTFVLVTHDQEEALGMATRLGVMRAGRLVQTGTPAALYEAPGDRFVAEFLGAANILRGRVRDPAEGRIDLPGLGELLVETILPMPAGREVDVALRPERLHLAAGQGPNRLAATLDGAAYRGDALVLTVILADGTRLTLTQPPGTPPEAGAALTVGWAPGAAIVLPA